MSETNSITPNSLVTVGKVRDAHGLKGELFIIFFAGEADWVSEDFKEFFLFRKEEELQSDGHKVWVEKKYVMNPVRLKKHKKGMIIKTKELDDRTAAEAFIGATFQIAAQHLVSKVGDKIFLNEVKGFEVLQQDMKVGPVVGFATNNAQDLLIVETEGGSQVEIPFIPEFIHHLDLKNKMIKMNLPEGLLGEP